MKSKNHPFLFSPACCWLLPRQAIFPGLLLALAEAGCLLLSVLSLASPNSVEIKVSADRSIAYIGDRIRYTMSVSSDKNTEIKFSPIEATLGEFIVKDTGISKPAEKAGRRESSRWSILTIYKTGRQMIPQQIVKYRVKGEGEWTSVKTDFVKIEVKSLLAEDTKAKDIRDIKDILGFHARQILKIALAALAAALTSSLFFALKKRFFKEKTHPPKSAHALAYEELERIKMSALLSDGKVKEYYYRLSGCIRHYLENRFSLRAPEMTLEEFLIAMKDSAMLEEGHKDLLKGFLENSDMVKFAKYSATRREAEEAHSFVKRFVDETKIEDREQRTENRKQKTENKRQRRKR